MNTGHFEGQIKAFAESDVSREQCGLVLRNPGGLLYATHERNEAPEPEHFFAIAAKVHLAAVTAGNLVGYWHSHNPGGDTGPSAADMAVADELGLPCWVWIVETQTLHCYVPKDKRAPLEGRQFLPMVHDCVSLVWDYYRTVLGIELPFVARVQADYRRGFRQSLAPLLQAAGADIVQGPPARHDIVLMALDAPHINHAGVYIGEGIMLHQVLNRKSERVPYGGYWERSTVALVRLPGAKATAESVPVRPINEDGPERSTV
jgi:proteasome lid subunit RPN8/RPN11